MEKQQQYKRILQKIINETEQKKIKTSNELVQALKFEIKHSHLLVDLK